MGSITSRRKKSAWAAVAVADDRRVAGTVDAHQQYGGQLVAPAIGLAADLHRLRREALRGVAALLRPGVARFQPAPALIEERQRHNNAYKGQQHLRAPELLCPVLFKSCLQAARAFISRDGQALRVHPVDDLVG